MKQKKEASMASDRVVDYLADRILSGQLRPGDRIKQDELATELDVSRIPVRDALRILESRGLLTIRPNAGARVTSLSAKDMDLSYKIRELLEPLLLADSMPHLTDEDLDDLEEIKVRLEGVQNLDEFMPLSREFHWKTFSRHSSPLLAQIVERLWDTTQSYRAAYAHLAMKDANRMQIMRAERDLLFGMIARREVDLAPAFLGVHIRRTHMALAEYMHLLDTSSD